MSQDLIMDTLRKTTPQFVLCILPNPHAVPDWQKVRWYSPVVVYSHFWDIELRPNIP